MGYIPWISSVGGVVVVLFCIIITTVTTQVISVNHRPQPKYAPLQRTHHHLLTISIKNLKMLYRQLSKLAVVGERSEAPKANQSRLRRPTPYSIEQYRHEGVRASKDDNPPVDSPRGRSQSSTWTPTRTRAPTPHPSATKSRPRDEKKTVRWTDSLEQESPEQKCDPVPAPSRKKSALKRQPATEQKEETSTEKEEDRPDNSSEEPAKPKTDAKAGSQADQPRTLRRDRRSSIPRPKSMVSRNISKPIALPSVAPERPPSPLIPQAVPAPLRLSQRRSRGQAIPLSASAAAVTGKAKHDSSAIKPSDKNQPVPTSARDFSFDAKPEVITVSSRSAYQSRPLSTTNDNLPTSRSTSYLQAKPKRNGTIRPAPKVEHEPVRIGDSSAIKPTTALPESSSTKSFHSVKNFWTEKSASANDCNASKSITSKPVPATSKPATVGVLPSCSSSSKPLPSSTSTSSFHLVKDFWSGISASSSCGAIVSGSSPDPSSKPALPMPKSSSSKDLPKTSMVSSLSRYTVNEKYGARKGVVSGSMSSTAVTSGSRLPRSSSALPYRPAKSSITVPDDSSRSKTSSSQPQGHSKPTAGSSVSTASKNSSSISNSSSYHTAPSHLSTTSTSDIDANAQNSMAAIPTSIEPDYIPAIQSELWNKIMNFCRSDSSSIPPGERYCDCDDCVWSDEKDLRECSTVARVGNDKGKCKARRQ